VSRSDLTPAMRDALLLAARSPSELRACAPSSVLNLLSAGLVAGVSVGPLEYRWRATDAGLDALRALVST
jgi:hypothetical protein